jgi:hypothetical protein
MNERIRELYYECQDESQSTEQCYQKFAELIVQECICQCDDENSQKYIMSHFRSLLPIGFTEKDWS